MLFHNMGSIAEPKSISLCIMCIARRHPEKFFKHFVLIFLRNANAIIFYTQFHILLVAIQFNLYRRLRIAVLQRIVKQVEYHTQQMQAVAL